MKKLFSLILLGLLCSVGSVWGAGTAIASLNFNSPATLPSGYTYSSSNSPVIASADEKNVVNITSGGGSTAPTFSADNSSAPTGGKRWMAFQPAEDCTVTFKVRAANNSRVFYLLDKDKSTTSSSVSSFTATTKDTWYDTWSVELTGGTWYALIGSGSNCYITSMQFTPAFQASFDKAAGSSLVKSTGTVTVSSAGNTVYYKWSTSSSAYGENDGSTLAGAADGSGSSSVNATAPATTGTWYLYAVAKNAKNEYSKVSSRNYTITNQTYSVTYNLNGASGDAPTEAAKEKDAVFTLAAAPTRECYTFDGWLCNIDDVTYDAEAEYTMTAANTTFTAQWTPKYASTRDFAAVVNAGTQASNDIATFLAAGNMESSGLSSSVWETGNSPSSEYVGYKLKDAGATIKFLVQAGKKVTITLGNVGAAATLYKDNTTSTIAQSTGSGVQTVIPAFTPENDMLVKIVTSSTATVTLKSIVIETPADYSITTSATNGSIDVVSGANENDNVEISATPNTGYEFTSWSIYKTGDTETTITPAAATASTSFTMPAYDVTVSATFTAIDYSITANDAENGTYTVKIGEDEVTTANYGQTITLDATPDDGYYLSAWTVTKASSGTVTVTNNQFTMPAEDVTIAATFSVANTLTYNANGGTGSMANTLGVGSVSLRPNGYKNAGYTFMGWATSQVNADAGTVEYADQASYTLSADAELFAVWEESYCHLIPATSGSTIFASDVIDMQSGSFGGSIMALSENLSYNAYGLQFGTNSSTKASVTLNDFLKVGSVITMKFTSNGTGSRGLKIYTSDGKTNVATLGWSGDATNGAVGIFRYTVVADDGLEGMKEFQLWRNNTVTMEYLTVVNAQPGGTISEAGWSSYSCNKPLDLSTLTATSGASAYYASAASGSTVTLTSKTGTVAAGTGLMIKGTAGETFTIDVAANGDDISTINLLKASDGSEVAASTAGTYHYIFGYASSSVYGFYNLTSDTQVPAGKAYLETTTALTEQNAPAIIRIVDEENNATSIERLDGKTDAIKFIEDGKLYILRDGVVYDALGRMVR